MKKMQPNERTKTWKQIREHTKMIKKLQKELRTLKTSLEEILDDELEQVDRPLLLKVRRTP